MKTPLRNDEAMNMRHLDRYLQTIVLASVLFAMFSSCTDDLSVSPEESNMDRVPVLESSAKDVVLDLASFNETAVEFTWSRGSNRGTNSAIDYALEFDVMGDNFGSPVAVEMGRATYSKAYTAEQFNTLLIEQLGFAPETNGQIQVRVESSAADSTVSPDYSNVLDLTVTPYHPVTSTLYLIGSAAPTGWDAGNATAMDRNSDAPFIFTYEGTLAPGEFKFITTLGEFLPSYNRGASDSELLYRSEESQPDDPFVVDEAGPYLISANLAEMTISIEKMAGPSYDELWVVGSATPNGWDLDNAAEMRQDPGDPFLFDYNEVLGEGEFKIATAKNWDAPFYRPTENGPDLSNPEVQLSAGEPDNKWYISEPGAYKITLDTRDMTISIESFTPYEQLWIVGDATPNGWNIDNPNEMQASPDDPYVFTYNGPLSAGEFKFPVSTGDWGADYFMPGVNHPPLESTYVRFIPGGQPDNKWQIEEAGTYSITLNQLYETIQIERQ